MQPSSVGKATTWPRSSSSRSPRVAIPLQSEGGERRNHRHLRDVQLEGCREERHRIGEDQRGRRGSRRPDLELVPQPGELLGHACTCFRVVGIPGERHLEFGEARCEPERRRNPGALVHVRDRCGAHGSRRPALWRSNPNPSAVSIRCATRSAREHRGLDLGRRQDRNASRPRRRRRRRSSPPGADAARSRPSGKGIRSVPVPPRRRGRPSAVRRRASTTLRGSPCHRGMIDG